MPSAHNPEPVEVGGRSSGGPAPGWTQVRSLQRSHIRIFGQGPGLDGWPAEDGQLVRTATLEGGQAGSDNGEALLTRSPQLPDIQAAQSYKIPKSFTYQSPLRLPLNILEEPPLKPRLLKKDKASLPPIAIYQSPREDTLRSSRNETPLFPPPSGPLHIELQSERYQELLTPAETRFLEHMDNSRSPSNLEYTSPHIPHQVTCWFSATV